MDRARGTETLTRRPDPGSYPPPGLYVIFCCPSEPGRHPPHPSYAVPSWGKVAPSSGFSQELARQPALHTWLRGGCKSGVPSPPPAVLAQAGAGSWSPHPPHTHTHHPLLQRCLLRLGLDPGHRSPYTHHPATFAHLRQLRGNLDSLTRGLQSLQKRRGISLPLPLPQPPPSNSSRPPSQLHCL